MCRRRFDMDRRIADEAAIRIDGVEEADALLSAAQRTTIERVAVERALLVRWRWRYS